MADRGRAFEDRFVVYFDFLGTRDAIRNWSSARLDQFVELLQFLVRSRGRQEISGMPQNDGSYKITVKAEISAFSDHVVVSYSDFRYDEKEGGDVFRPHWASIVCQDGIRIVSQIAELALRQGLLLRGAISLGELFHDEDVVFGEALVHAHHLESTEAKYPRIVVSKRILSLFPDGPAAHSDLFIQDQADGIWHLNYFRQMPKHGGGVGSPANVQRWNEATMKIVADNISAMSDQSVPLEKWRWFEKQMARAWGV